MIRAALLPLLLLVAPHLLFAQSEETVTVPGNHRISILVPPGYSFQVDRDTMNNARVRMEDPVWPIAITALIVAASDPAITTEQWQRNELISRIAPTLPDAKETDYNIKPLHPASGSGVFCVLTDGRYQRVEDLPVGEYMNVTGGVKAWRGCFVYFAIMSNNVTSPEYQEAFQLFQTSFTQ